VKIDRVVAIHEAGHAIARYPTADDLGYTTDTAISYIDVAEPPDEPRSERPTGTLKKPQQEVHSHVISAGLHMQDWRSVVQHHVQQGAMDAHVAVVIDEPHPPEFVQE
jgi:hypothetical protein